MIDRQTFEQVQKVLDAHRASGDRSQATTTTSSARSSAGLRQAPRVRAPSRNRNGDYTSTSAASAASSARALPAPYFPSSRPNAPSSANTRHCAQRPRSDSHPRDAARPCPDQRGDRPHEADRHTRRLHELTGQQQKLVQLYYKGGVSEEVMKPSRAHRGRAAKAQRWSDAAKRQVEDVIGALEDALGPGQRHRHDETLPHSPAPHQPGDLPVLIVQDPDTIEAKRTPLYDEIVPLIQD